jgi:hypothetical protein
MLGVRLVGRTEVSNPSLPSLVELVPFQPGDVTCGRAQGTVSDPIGVRLRPLGHVVHAAIRTSSRLSAGELTVARVRPQASSTLIKANLPDIDGTTDGPACIRLFDVQEVKAPTQGAPRPHSEMEIYRVSLRWQEAQPCSTEIAVVDCDSVLSCYEDAGRVILERWRTSNPGTTADGTWHLFLTALARNGARALCDAYRQSAVTTPPGFRDHRWAACLSTVLAEDYYRVFAEQSEITPEWGSFLRPGDRDFSSRLSMVKLHSYLESSRVFANAHTRDGVRRATDANRCGRPPSARSDLERVADVLIAAQTPLLDALHVRVPFGRSAPPLFARRTFARYLRDSLEAGLT